MKILTKELRNNIDFQEIQCALNSVEKRTMPIFFLNGDEGIENSDMRIVRTQFNMSDKENELKFLIMPATFTFFMGYDENAFEKEMHSPENDFLSQYVNRLRLIQYLPEEILSKVKDKRLLAIGYADQKVKNAIQSYTKIKINDAYTILERSLKSSLKASVGLTIKNQFEKHSYIYSIEELFDETYITNVCKKGNDLYIELDGENTIVLSEVETLEEEIDPQNTEISLFELYKVKQDYELHFLLKVIDDNLAESFHYVTYKFKDMYFHYMK